MKRHGALTPARVRFRAFRYLLGFGVAALLVALVPGGAFAVCGDGIADPGEQCDPGVTPGPCFGSCVQPGFPDACTCAGPSTSAADYILIAGSSIRLGSAVEVTAGHVAIEGNGGFLTVGEAVDLPVNDEVIADRVRLMPSSTVGRLFANS